jgi:hypothetical protein
VAGAFVEHVVDMFRDRREARQVVVGLARDAHGCGFAGSDGEPPRSRAGFDPKGVSGWGDLIIPATVYASSPLPSVAVKVGLLNR